jgi:UDP-N-acetylglucosamine 2-epimerase
VPGRAEVVGDVMADATRVFAPIARRRAAVASPPYAVLTIHRQANTEAERLRAIVDAIATVDHRFVFPVHPRTRQALADGRIALPSNVEPLEPVSYLEMLALVAAADVVVTDSGGLQKEAYWLQVPCVTIRPSTEWVDTVEAGANTLTEPEGLADALAGARFPPEAPTLYGDGHAAERIAASLYA